MLGADSVFKNPVFFVLYLAINETELKHWSRYCLVILRSEQQSKQCGWLLVVSAKPNKQTYKSETPNRPLQNTIQKLNIEFIW